MKTMKLASLLVMLAMTLNVAAQEEFFDDVYFSSGKDNKSEKVEKKTAVSTNTSKTSTQAVKATSTAPSSKSDNISEMDVDAYNRRYVDTDEDLYMEDEEWYAEEGEQKQNKDERRSDTEDTVRIVRYHSPSE